MSGSSFLSVRRPAEYELGMPSSEAVKSKKLFSPFAFLLGLMATSCAGPAKPAPAPLVALEAAQTPNLVSREAARAVDLLTKLLVVDRNAVELSEAELGRVRDLAKAGRLGEADLLTAELELLKQRKQLLLHEQELADAQLAAAADAPQAARR
jgi:hypothetical protein